MLGSQNHESKESLYISLLLPPIAYTQVINSSFSDKASSGAVCNM